MPGTGIESSQESRVPRERVAGLLREAAGAAAGPEAAVSTLGPRPALPSVSRARVRRLAAAPGPGPGGAREGRGSDPVFETTC